MRFWAGSFYRFKNLEKMRKKRARQKQKVREGQEFFESALYIFIIFLSLSLRFSGFIFGCILYKYNIQQARFLKNKFILYIIYII